MLQLCFLHRTESRCTVVGDMVNLAAEIQKHNKLSKAPAPRQPPRPAGTPPSRAIAGRSRQSSAATAPLMAWHTR